LKPVALITKLINFVDANIIADPFLGSGTTMVAAQNLGRKCYGIEIAPPYCAVILQRMQNTFPSLEIKRI
jgi:DNA modification methylase